MSETKVRKTRTVTKRVSKKKQEPQEQLPPQEVVPEPVLEPEPVVEPELETVVLETLQQCENGVCSLDDLVESKPRVKRQKLSRDEVSAAFDELVLSFDNHLKENANGSLPPVHQKFLKTQKKNLKALKTEALKMTKKEKKEKRETSTTKNPSGLTKPVRISSDLAQFIGCSEDEQKSRVEVTKILCNYIKSHDLQNPQNKKEILPDATLSKLVDYDENQHGPLTYCSIHKLIQKHFLKN